MFHVCQFFSMSITIITSPTVFPLHSTRLLLNTQMIIEAWCGPNASQRCRDVAVIRQTHRIGRWTGGHIVVVEIEHVLVVYQNGQRLETLAHLAGDVGMQAKCIFQTRRQTIQTQFDNVENGYMFGKYCILPLTNICLYVVRVEIYFKTLEDHEYLQKRFSRCSQLS